MPASLVIQTSHLGDTILTTPLIARVAPLGPVVVIATPLAAPVLANNPAIHATIVYDKRGAHRGAGGFRRIAREVRELLRSVSPQSRSEHGGAIAYVAQGSFRSGALAMAAGVRTRVGLSSSPGRIFATRVVEFRGLQHHAERLWSLANLEVPGSTAPTMAMLRPRLYPGGAERAAVSELLAGREGEDPLLVLAPGSRWGTKRWPHFPALARRLAEHFRLAVVGAAEDRVLAAAIVSEVGDRAIDATGRLSLLATAELIGRAAGIVTNDSAPLHLASAMGTPTVAIFGPTVPVFGFGPLAPSSVIAQHDRMPCRPCDPHGPERCPLGHWRCMRDLEPVAVAEQTLTLLTASRV